MTNDEFDILDAMLREAEKAEELSGRNRIRVQLWNRDDAFEDRTLFGGAEPGEFAYQLRTVMEQAARWRAIVETAKAALGTD
jgi:hypothetical protein